MSCTTSFNRSVLSKLSWMSRQLRRYEELQSIHLWANSMHLVKNLLILPETPDNSAPASHVSNWKDTISGMYSPSSFTVSPRNNANCPPGFTPTDILASQPGSQINKHFIKTGFHNSVTHNKQRSGRFQPLARTSLGTTTTWSSNSSIRPSLSICHLPAINFAPTISSYNKSDNMSLSHLPISNFCFSIDSAMDVSFSPILNVPRTPEATTKPTSNEELLPQ